MRIPISKISTLPFYSSEKERLCCGQTKKTPFVFPNKDAVNFQFTYGNDQYIFFGAAIYNEIGNLVPTGDVIGTEIFKDVDNDGNDEGFFQVSGLSGQVTASQGYYIELLFGTPDGLKTYYSELFNICPDVCYKIEYSDDCDSADYGCFSNGFTNCLYLKNFEPGSPNISENLETLTNGNNDEKDIYTSVSITNNATVIGSNSLYESMLFIKYFANIDLINVEAGCKWRLNSFIGVSGAGCYGRMGVSWTCPELEKADGCCESSYNNAPFIDCDDNPDPPIDCEGYEIEIIENGGVLTYNIINNPDDTATPLVSWEVNGIYEGSSETVVKGPYGTYELTITIAGCTATTSYLCLDPCANFSVDLICNGLTIDGAINGVPDGETPVVKICDNDGNEIGNAFPFTVPEDGAYTVKVTTESCEDIQIVECGDGACNFDFSISKDENGQLSPTITGDCENPVFQWTKIVDGDAETPVSTSEQYTPTESGGYLLYITCDGCVKSKLYVCLIPEEKQQFEICNWDHFIELLQDADINVNIPNKINVNICNTCDNPVPICNCGECEESPCPTGSINVICVNCEVQFEITGYEGYTWTVNGDPYSSGDVLTPTEDTTYNLIGNLDGCPEVTFDYNFIKRDAGPNTTKTITKP